MSNKGLKQSIEDYLSSSVRNDIKKRIDQVEGNEVVFVGKTNASKIVEQVKVIARGNQFSVPLVQEAAERSDVVIHNHPSDLLDPSENDIYNAHKLAQLGVASYIVNNHVTEIYVVVEPIRKDAVLKLEIEDVCESLSPGGLVSKYLKNYEDRPEQIEMIKHVAESFNDKKIAVIEAGTGVGKSLAYLIPAIIWSTKNNERCVVSTRTINLQEQLIHKDIPFLKKILGIDFEAILVKGRGNYVCLRKVDSLKQDQELLIQDADKQEINTILEWIKSSKDGSKSDLSFLPQSSVWEQVGSESDNCLRFSCPFYKSCFVYKARREANQANILVANHHLLFSDLAVRATGADMAVLPKYHHIILDEAHNIEDIATDYFGIGLTRYGINRILGRLHFTKKNKATGFLDILLKKLTFAFHKNQINELQDIIGKIQIEFIPQIESAIALNNDLMDEISDFVSSFENNYKREIKIRINSRFRGYPGWSSKLIPQIKNFIQLLKRLISGLNSALNKLEDINLKLSKDIFSIKIDVDAQRRRIQSIVEALTTIALNDDDENVRWIEVTKRSSGKDLVRLKLAPLDISDSMNKMVYNNYNTIVMTSATLTISGFNNKDVFFYFFKQIGLDQVEADKITKTIIPAPFNYKKQSITAIPTDIPAPDSKDFMGAISEIIFKALEISKGRAFILFTSYGLLNLTFNALESRLAQIGITSFKQGQMNRFQLLKKFKDDKNSVLFGTDSFWQGVDVEGEALESVIITKLPFKVPSEPIIEARVEAIEKRGGNAFMEYSVPIAVLKLKQGFGRLIRKKTDIGSVYILDKRIIEKFYGRIFINSLPKSNIISGKVDDVLQKVQYFFKNVK